MVPADQWDNTKAKKLSCHNCIELAKSFPGRVTGFKTVEIDLFDWH